nr:MAG TPA: hypothetical protein [Caudoviricetes sp.]
MSFFISALLKNITPHFYFYYPPIINLPLILILY